MMKHAPYSLFPIQQGAQSLNHLFDQVTPWDRYVVQLFGTSHSGPRLMMRPSTWFQRSHEKQHLEKKVQTFTVSRTSTNSLLYAKVWVNKRKSFELSLIHRLKQIFVGWRKLRHVHGKVRIKVLGVVIRRLREEKKKTLRSKEVSIFSEASCRGSDNVFLCCCLLLRVVAQSSKPVKLRAKGCNNSQHCFARSSRKLGHGLLIQTLIFSIFLKGLGSVLKGNLHSYYRI